MPAHLPTSQPQRCRTCSFQLPPDHFAIHFTNRTGCQTQCRACAHDYQLRRRIAQPPPTPVEPKQCLDCGETKPAAAFHPGTNRTDGLRAYCKPCAHERTNLQRKARASPQQPPPQQLVCRGPCRQLKPVAAFARKPGTLFGIGSVCKACVSVRDIMRRRTPRPAVNDAGSAASHAGDGDSRKAMIGGSRPPAWSHHQA